MGAQKTIFLSLIQFQLSYHSLEWRLRAKLKPLIAAYKRIIRAIAKLKKADHTTSTYEDLQILKYLEISTVFVYRSLHNNEDDIFHFRVNANCFYATIIDINPHYEINSKSGFHTVPRCENMEQLPNLLLAASNEVFGGCC